MTIKTHLYAILEKAEEGDRLSRTVDLFIITLIVLNVTMVILETVEGINETYGEFIERFETVCVLIFTFEYALRIWCCTADKKFAHALKGRLAFMLTPLALIDLIAIFPLLRLLAGHNTARLHAPPALVAVVSPAQSKPLFPFHANVWPGNMAKTSGTLSRGICTNAFIGHCIQLNVFCRTPCTARSLFEHSDNHVVGHCNADNRGLRRCLSHNAIGQISGGNNCRTRRRHVCLARWHLEFWICRSHAGISSRQ